MAALTTRLYTWIYGNKVGEDPYGNHYYTRDHGSDKMQERWVIYKGDSEASKVPAAWHGWLHHTVNHTPTLRQAATWEKPHLPNLTGTPQAVFPKGHSKSQGERNPARGDYQPWRPEDQ